MTIHKTIEDELAHRGESIRDCAKACGIQYSNLTKYLRVGKGISAEKLERVMNYLKLEVIEERGLYVCACCCKRVEEFNVVNKKKE